MSDNIKKEEKKLKKKQKREKKEEKIYAFRFPFSCSRWKCTSLYIDFRICHIINRHQRSRL